MRVKTHNIFAKLNATMLLLAFALYLVAPIVTSAQVAARNEENKAKDVSLKEVAGVPEVIMGTKKSVDLSEVDWNQEVEVDGGTVKLNSDIALEAFNVDSDVAKVVRTYREDLEALDDSVLLQQQGKNKVKRHLAEGLQYDIAQLLIEKGQLPEDYFGNMGSDTFVHGNMGSDTFVQTPLFSKKCGVVTSL